MGKIDLVIKKEDMNREQMENKIAVVFDVLLATSTITSALENGAREVVPVFNREGALSEAKERMEGSYLLSGEYGGVVLEGFISPLPLDLEKAVDGKTMILATTNGTVAIKNSASAKKVFAACLLNGEAVADAIRHVYKDETVIVVCSSSKRGLSFEDFYGAGYFLDCLVGENEADWELTDSARAALFFYKGNKANSFQMLEQSRIGKKLCEAGKAEDVRYVAQRGVFSVIPVFNGHAIVNANIEI